MEVRKELKTFKPSVSFWRGAMVSIISLSILLCTFEFTQTSNSVKMLSIPLGDRLAWFRARIRVLMGILLDQFFRFNLIYV
jgi:hypothetical protein